MGAITVRAKVDANGILRLELPLGREAAGRDVRIVVDELAKSATTDAEDMARIRKRVSAGEWGEKSEFPTIRYSMDHLRSTESLLQPNNQQEWAEWVRSVSGTITDPSFVRPEQGESETRDSLT